MERILRAAPLFFIAVGLGCVVWWVLVDPTSDFITSEPGRDGFTTSDEMAEIVEIGAFFEAYSGTEAALSEVWSGFRGAFFDNIYRSPIALKEDFGSQPPEILWSAELGEGHSGAAIYKGLVYLLDYDEELRADMLRCFSLTTGEEIWRRWYHVMVRRNHGMSRTVPAITDDYIVTMGPRGHVMCVARENGDLLWSIDLVSTYGTEIPLWYTGQCPLIDNGVAILAPAGTALMIGVDCATGEVLWEAPNPDSWTMSHSSIAPYDFGGHRMYVYAATGGVAGVAAGGPDAGSILWKTSEWNHPVIASSPVCMPDGKIFLTAGYGAGSSLLQLSVSEGSYQVETLKSFKPGEGLSSEQQTPILTDGHLFGILPKDARTLRNQMVCVNPSDPTQIIWASGPTSRFGLGPFILADNKFFLLDDDGTLYVIRKNTSRFELLDQIKLFDGHDAWAPLALADGYMVLRDSRTMFCINLKR